MEQLIFVINPISGTGSKDLLEGLIKSKIDRKRFEPTIRYSEYAGHSIEIARESVKKGVENLVAVGGDGTINELGNELMDTEVNLGIIPKGSGNGLARHLGISIDTEEALIALNNSVSMRIDAGTMNGRAFFCTAGMGFDAHIGKVFAESDSRGLATYVQKTLTEFLSYKPQTYTVNSDGTAAKKEAFLITFANAAQYGNNAMIAPLADIQDGFLDMCTISPFPALVGLDMGRRLFDGTLGNSKFSTIRKVTNVLIERQEAGPVHVDGEPVEMGKNIEVSVKPSALKVLVTKSKS